MFMVALAFHEFSMSEVKVITKGKVITKVKVITKYQLR